MTLLLLALYPRAIGRGVVLLAILWSNCGSFFVFWDWTHLLPMCSPLTLSPNLARIIHVPLLACMYWSVQPGQMENELAKWSHSHSSDHQRIWSRSSVVKLILVSPNPAVTNLVVNFVWINIGRRSSSMCYLWCRSLDTITWCHTGSWYYIRMDAWQSPPCTWVEGYNCSSLVWFFKLLHLPASISSNHCWRWLPVTWEELLRKWVLLLGLPWWVIPRCLCFLSAVATAPSPWHTV